MNYTSDEVPPKLFLGLVLGIGLIILVAFGGYIFRDKSTPNASIHDTNTYYKAIVPSMSFTGGALQDYVWQRAVENGLDVWDVMATVRGESSFNPYARNHNKNGTWDIGLWQINDVHRISVELRLDPYWSTDWAMVKWKVNPSIWVAYNNL